MKKPLYILLLLPLIGVGQTTSPVTYGDTIVYYFADDFETWTTPMLASDSITQLLPAKPSGWQNSGNSIVDVGGSHDNVWDQLIPYGYNYGSVCYFTLPSDTITDAFIEFDLWVDHGFDPEGIGGGQFTLL